MCLYVQWPGAELQDAEVTTGESGWETCVGEEVGMDDSWGELS